MPERLTLTEMRNFQKGSVIKKMNLIQGGIITISAITSWDGISNTFLTAHKGLDPMFYLSSVSNDDGGINN